MDKHNKKEKVTHTATNTTINVGADAKRYMCFFNCMRTSEKDVVDPNPSPKKPELEPSEISKTPS